MKISILIVFLLIHISLFSQNKKDTEIWLSETLDKNFNIDLVSYNPDGTFTHQPTEFTHFTFEGTLLVCTKQYFTRVGNDLKYEKQTKTTIELKNINEISIDTSTNFLYGLTFYKYVIQLKCDRDKVDFENHAIKEYDERGKLIKNTQYSLQYNITSGLECVTKNNIIFRVKKSFEHLLELYGVTLKKDIF